MRCQATCSQQKGYTLLANWGERLFFDISSPSTPTFGGKHHWLLVINDCSDYCWSFFLKEKSDLAQTMLGLVNNLKIKLNLQVQRLCCDNAGKNQAFERTCNHEGLGINFKYTAPCTPQQNGSLNASLLPFSTGYMPCSTVESLLPTKRCLGRSSDHCHTPWE